MRSIAATVLIQAEGSPSLATAFDLAQRLVLAAYAVVLLLLLAGTVALVVLMVTHMKHGDLPGIQTHWGGLGGGLGGWQASRSLACLLGAVTFASLFVLTFNQGISRLSAGSAPAVDARSGGTGGPPDSRNAGDPATGTGAAGAPSTQAASDTTSA